MSSDEDSVRYWLVESGDAVEAKRYVIALLDEQNEKAIAMQKRVGAQRRYELDGRIVGFGFDTAPDAKHWKHLGDVLDGYSPKGNTKVGKELSRELDDIPEYSNKTIGTEFLGAWSAHARHTPNRIVFAGLDDIDGQWVVRAKDSAEWEPVEGLREINASEYWAMKERRELTAKG